MRIDIMVMDGIFDTGLATLMDCFALAAALGGNPDADAPRFVVRRIGARPSATTAHGLVAPIEAVVDPSSPAPDVVIVPALGCVVPADLATALERPDVADTCAVLRRWREAGTRIAAACTGTFVVAESGLLDGYRATTSWWLDPEFRRRYPKVALDASHMIVVEPGIVTAGAALAHVDLALWLIRQISPHAANVTARYLLHAHRPSQATYAMVDHLAHDDPVVERFERWVRSHLRDFTIVDAARAVGASPRTLQRRVRRVLGRTPIAYVQDVRVEHALHRLRTGRDTLDEIADAVGYTDPVSLRTLLRRKTGRTIKDLRAGA